MEGWGSVSRDPNFALHDIWTAPHEVTSGRWSVCGHNSESCFHLNFHFLLQWKKNTQTINIVRIAKAVLLKLPGKLSFNVSVLFFLSVLPMTSRTTMTVTQSVR